MPEYILLAEDSISDLDYSPMMLGKEKRQRDTMAACKNRRTKQRKREEIVLIQQSCLFMGLFFLCLFGTAILL